MRVRALVDVDVVALERAEELSVMVELEAPIAERAAAVVPATLVFVFDRSGSMAGERLDAAKHALAALIARLRPSDRFGLVCFDESASIVVPAEPLGDRPAARAAIQRIQPGGMTDVSAGLLRGVQEATRVMDAGGAGKVIVLSDGHANRGVVEQAALERIAASALSRGVTVATIGLGLD